MELIFIYHATSGKLNAFIDFTHKIVSPKTYQCQLCSLTYGNFGMRKEWRDFLTELDVKITFLYKNQATSYQHFYTKLPVVLIKNANENPQELITSTQFKNVQNVNQLIATIKEKINSPNANN